jgi:hypothetical protein
MEDREEAERLGTEETEGAHRCAPRRFWQSSADAQRALSDT